MAIIQLRRLSWGCLEGFRAICSRRCSSDGVRNPIGRRTESDWTADGIRLDGVRNLIGRRTESDWTANGIRLDGGRER